MSHRELTLEDLVAGGPMAPIPNPYPLLARLRRESPVVHLPASEQALGEVTGPGSVMLTRHDDVKEALRDDDAFSSAIVQRTMGIVMGPTIVGMDGSEHLKHRALITPALSPAALRGDFPALVRRFADESVDRFASKGSADLKADFAYSYPLAVFIEILGLPLEGLDEFHSWAIDLTNVAHDPPRGIAASQKMLATLEPVVRRKRENPEADLISELVTGEVEGERLTDFEVVSFLRLLVLAGAETTNHLLGSALYCLLRDPDLMDRVQSDRSLLPALLHETLRWESPIATVIREATADTEIAGVAVAAGTSVLCHIGSANRDEERFSDPDRFDIDRVDKNHIAFGFGKHYCAGSRLALLEAQVGINAVLDRLSNLRPQPGEKFDIIGFAFRGPNRLPVHFDAE
jgi:cytochrome P450